MNRINKTLEALYTKKRVYLKDNMNNIREVSRMAITQEEKIQKLQTHSTEEVNTRQKMDRWQEDI